MKGFLKNNWQIITIEALILLIFIIFFGKFGDLMVDSYREAYIPLRVIEGKALYKDIFTIYAPFSYLLNALLYKIFGTSLNVLYFAGLFCTMGIFYLTYKISSLFLEKKYSFVICLFSISALVLSPNVFNPFLPYSYGIIYGLLFVLLAIYCMLIKKLPIAYLFYSLAICCKYEFLLLLPLLIFKSEKREFCKNIIAFSIPIIISVILLKLTGTRSCDIEATLEVLFSMSKTKTFNWFYSVSGLTFNKEILFHYFVSIMNFVIPISLLLTIQKFLKGSKKSLKNRFCAGILILIFIILLSFVVAKTPSKEILVFAFPFILLMFFIRLKALNSAEKVFIISSLLVSVKVFFALLIQSYGTYFIPLALVSIFILTPKKCRTLIATILLLWTIIIGIENCKVFKFKNFKKIEKVIEYIDTNAKITDRVVVYPEGLSINVFTNRRSDDKFYSMIPLYVETFGEDMVVKRLEIVKPEYIIISNYDTIVYYFREFGKDYALNVFNWIEKNYVLKEFIQDELTYKIYKLKSD